MDFLLSFMTLETMLLIGFGSIVGLCLGLTGVGGGVLIIPLLTVFFDMDTVMAVGTASIIATLVKVNASYAHIRLENVAWRPLTWMLIGAIPMTLLMTFAISYLSELEEKVDLVNQSIELVISVVIIISFISIFYQYRQTSSAKPVVEYKSKSLAVAAGMTCGAIIGSTGVGGGVMLLPAFNSLLGVNIKFSVGSSVVMALVLSTITAISYSANGQSDLTAAVFMTIGAFIGVPIAVRILKHLADSQVYILTLGVIFLSFILLLVD